MLRHFIKLAPLLLAIALPSNLGLAALGGIAPTSSSSPPSSITNMVAIERSGSTQTNVPYSIGVTFDVGDIDSSHHVVATDGISGNPITCDENNRYSDIGGTNSGTAAVRGTTLSCVIPSLTSSTTDTIALSVASG